MMRAVAMLCMLGLGGCHVGGIVFVFGGQCQSSMRIETLLSELPDGFYEVDVLFDGRSPRCDFHEPYDAGPQRCPETMSLDVYSYDGEQPFLRASLWELGRGAPPVDAATLRAYSDGQLFFEVDFEPVWTNDCEENTDLCDPGCWYSDTVVSDPVP